MAFVLLCAGLCEGLVVGEWLRGGGAVGPGWVDALHYMGVLFSLSFEGVMGDAFVCVVWDRQMAWHGMLSLCTKVLRDIQSARIMDINFLSASLTSSPLSDGSDGDGDGDTE